MKIFYNVGDDVIFKKGWERCLLSQRKIDEIESCIKGGAIFKIYEHKLSLGYSVQNENTGRIVEYIDSHLFEPFDYVNVM